MNPLPKIQVIEWAGCYGDSWHGWIAPDAFTHPAKFSRGLARRILQHGIERGYWQPGDTIGDPFGGVACGGVIASSLGFRWIGVELEEKFVAIGQKNIEMHAEWYAKLGRHRPTLVQGDSRRFAEIVVGPVTSPPYADSLRRQKDGIDWEKAKQNGEHGEGHGKGVSCHATYGDDPANIGHLSGVVSSPPYAGIAAGAGGLNHLPAKADGQQSGRENGASQQTDTRYGGNAGQISRLREGSIDSAVTSPPFTTDQPRASQSDISKGRHQPGDAREHHMDHVANINALPPTALDGSVTSPPWEKNCEGGRAAGKLANPLANRRGNGASDAAVLAQAERDSQKTYGDSEGQIGREAGETYWEACSKVYASLFRAIKPGGFAAIVVKDYVKARQRVPLCDDTLRLLVAVGFEPVERAHAMLIEDNTHEDIFEGAITKRTQRKSFFRRLAEKNGSPEINFEEVLFVRRPCASVG